MIPSSADIPSIPKSANSSTIRNHKRPKLDHQPRSRALQLNESIFKHFNEARADALPLTRAANRNEFMSYFIWGDPNRDPRQKETAKVSLSTMLSFSTPNERALMCVGILMVRLDIVLMCAGFLKNCSVRSEHVIFRLPLLVLAYQFG